MLRKLLCKVIIAFGIYANAMVPTPVIHDVEIDLFIKRVVAKIDPQLKYKLIIFDDNIENAFTTIDKQGNVIIAIYAGLFKSLSAEEIIGVICHEIGHIKMKHVLNLSFIIQKLRYMNIVGIIPFLGQIMMQAEVNNLMLYSQVNEKSADLFSFKKLNELKWPVQGIYTLFDRWSKGEKMPYFASHPCSSIRKEMAYNFIKQTDTLPPSIQREYSCIQTRLRSNLYDKSNFAIKISDKKTTYELAWYNYLNLQYETTTIDQGARRNK
ncbi:MAG: M48 family metalloprotease [Alphaproteobacteria bacterium]|nr:MAG: M48 family metalloprotease [Alphaproteobacteria bacterium]